MLELRNICKEYRTGDSVQTALDHVNLTLSDMEFVAILGPSGSGKTTLLNIIGGLDRYDSGDLIIDGISTRNYSDRDWDAYRNRAVGFVFQNYNLIMHQSVLSNVELAITISGITYALVPLATALIRQKTGQMIRAALPPLMAAGLILLSVFLTLLAGLIPSGQAARSDPVAALRSE